MTLGEFSLATTFRWYLVHLRGRDDQPFYCDPTRVGAFAVEPGELARGGDAVVFRLFVTLSMYQALRDVTIMRQQRSLTRPLMRVVADVATIRRSISRHDCQMFHSGDAFDDGCNVTKDGEIVDCKTRPGVACHVKDATRVFNRMGDMGKLPTSAWLRLWKGRGVGALLDDVYRVTPSPRQRAKLLVERFAAVHRVGRKLATMFVSALSTPALAPGLTPWFPEIDGNELVVVDTNVARAVDALRPPGASKTYDARERWMREQASRIDLRTFHPDLPSYSPRLIQEALYAFCSKSNRIARGDICTGCTDPCVSCAPALCPFARSRDRAAASRSATAPPGTETRRL